MAVIDVKLKTISKISEDFQIYSSEMKRQIAQIEQIRNNLSFKIKQQAGINASISSALQALNSEKRKLNKLHNDLSQAAELYMRTEKNVCAKFGRTIDISEFKDIEGVKTGNQGKKSTGENDNIKYLVQLLNEIGIAGSGIAGIVDAIAVDKNSGTDTLEVLLKLIKGGNNQFGKIIEAQSDVNANWKEYLLGLNKVENKGFLQSIKEQFSDLDISSAKGKSKWFGNILDLGINGIENYKENGFTERALEETILETGIDLATGAVYTAISSAAIGAVAAAAGFGGVPAVLVGAGAVGIGWAVDSIYKTVTKSEDGIVEDASDFILDTGTKLYDEGKKVIHKVGNAISSAAKNITAGWRSVIFG